MPSLTPYERRAAARERQRQVALCGETLEAFHRRETAKPPTLREIYAANKVNRERCPWTVDLVEAISSQRRAKSPHQPVPTGRQGVSHETA